MSDCSCILARPAAFFGLSTFHSSLCLKHAESRFCMPVAPKSIQNAFLVRAQSKPAAEMVEADAGREMARQECVVATTPWSARPPTAGLHDPSKHSPLKSFKSMALQWETAERLSE